MTNNCTCCFTDYIVKCEDSIIVNTKFTPNTEYTWVITDKFDRQYSGLAAADEFGRLVIPVTDLPAGLLTEYSGSFVLQLFDSTEACKPINFVVAQEINCIEFTVRAGTREKNFLGCQFPD